MALPQTNITAFTGMNTPTRDDPVSFDDRAEDSWDRLGQSQAQFNTLATQVNAMATAASASEVIVQGYRNETNGYKIDALQYRNAAQTSANSSYDNAVISINAAANSATYRDQAQNYAAGLRGTSVTLLVIGIGAKALNTETGKQFAPGTFIKLVVTTNTSSYMAGYVTSYNAANGLMGVMITSVAAAFAGTSSASWNVLVCGDQGVPGPAGSVNGGNLAGALNGRAAPNVPVSATMDVWSGAGNYMGIIAGTGEPITNFTPAPQPGSKRTLLFGVTATLVSNANIFVYGGTQNLQVGDEVDVICDYANHYRAYVRKYDGTAVTPPKGFVPAAVAGSAAVYLMLANSEYHTYTMTGNTKFMFDFAGIPNGKTWTLELNVVSGIPEFPSSVRWPLDQAPNFAAGQIHMIVFVTAYSGTRVRASAITGYSS